MGVLTVSGKAVPEYGSRPFDLLVGHFREHGERQATPHHVFGHGEITRLVAQVLVGGLQRDRRRIVDSRSDALLPELLADGVAIRAAGEDDKQMPDVCFRPWRDG